MFDHVVFGVSGKAASKALFLKALAAAEVQRRNTKEIGKMLRWRANR